MTDTATVSIKGGPRERPWTAEHDKTLRVMKQAGMSLSTIGERLGRSQNAVSSRAYSLSVEEGEIKVERDYLGEKIEAYFARIFRLNRSAFSDVQQLKREAYGWR